MSPPVTTPAHKAGLQDKLNAKLKNEQPKSEQPLTEDEFLRQAARFCDDVDKLENFLEQHSHVKDDLLYFIASAKNPKPLWSSALPAFLRWISSKQLEMFQKTRRPDNFNEDDITSPVNLAIDYKNNYFLNCFLDLCINEDFDGSAILAQERYRGRNCLHLAIYEKLPCAAKMVRACSRGVFSRAALMKPDHLGYTPFHLAMTMTAGSPVQQNEFEPSSAPEEPPQANIGKPKTPTRRFHPADVFDELKELKDESHKTTLAELLKTTNKRGKSPYQDRRMAFNKNKNPNNWNADEERLQLGMKQMIYSGLDDIIPNVRKAMYGITGAVEKELCLDMSDFNRATHDFGQFIQKLSDETVLFEETLFFVYLPDLNNFLKKCPHEGVRQLFEWLGQIDEGGLARSIMKLLGKEEEDNTTAEIRDELLKNVKESIVWKLGIKSDKVEDGVCQLFKWLNPSNQQEGSQDQRPLTIITHNIDGKGSKTPIYDELLRQAITVNFNINRPSDKGARKIFNWLVDDINRVKTIMRLHIPDNTTAPISDELVKEAIIDRFIIERLDWRKLDINLDILTRSDNASSFKELTLYSSGNWGTLYHWSSEEGLGRLKNLGKLTIKIVRLNPSEEIHDKQAQDCHKSMGEKYKNRLIRRLEKLNFQFLPVDKMCVELNAEWEFPQLPELYRNTDDDTPQIAFLSQLAECQNFLADLNRQNLELKPGAKSPEPQTLLGRFRKLSSNPAGIDTRIKVAIIDNGTDIIKAPLKNKIAAGVSYVSATNEDEERILPWWTVADPHGTQMASLIAKVNPYCRLYIARVGKGRRDIKPKHAIEAIEWAIDQKVDIISISWVMKKPNQKLQDAIEKAAKMSILIFCSTADEGEYSGPVYPADYEEVVRVTATDKYGHKRPASKAVDVDVFVPGDDIEADSPSYIDDGVGKNQDPTKVSGSSVATAISAGIASLALLLLGLFNNLDNKDIEYLHTKKGIMQVFSQMDCNDGATGILLLKLFPAHRADLFSKWDISKFQKANKTMTK